MLADDILYLKFRPFHYLKFSKKFTDLLEMEVKKVLV